jgi:hypothetical protein
MNGFNAYDYSLYSDVPSTRPFGLASRASPAKLGPADDKKKHKSRRGNGEQDYVCHECGTDDSPGELAPLRDLQF